MTNTENNDPPENTIIHGQFDQNNILTQEVDSRIHQRFKVLTLLTGVINGGSLLLLLSLGIYGQATQASGLEFIALLFVPVVFLGYAFAIFYIIYYPYYLLKYKQRNRYVSLGAVIVVISLTLIAFQLHSSRTEKDGRAIANRILTVEEAQPLVDTCNIKAIDEGRKRVQGLRGDVTYISLNRPISGQSGSLERYVAYEDFDKIVAKVNQESGRCGKVNVYTAEDLRASRYP